MLIKKRVIIILTFEFLLSLFLFPTPVAAFFFHTIAVIVFLMFN
jgi:hypothetical protein